MVTHRTSRPLFFSLFCRLQSRYCSRYVYWRPRQGSPDVDSRQEEGCGGWGPRHAEWSSLVVFDPDTRSCHGHWSVHIQCVYWSGIFTSSSKLPMQPHLTHNLICTLLFRYLLFSDVYSIAATSLSTRTPRKAVEMMFLLCGRGTPTLIIWVILSQITLFICNQWKVM